MRRASLLLLKEESFFVRHGQRNFCRLNFPPSLTSATEEEHASRGAAPFVWFRFAVWRFGRRVPLATKLEKEQFESAGRWRESTRRARCTQSRSTIKTAVQVFAQLLLSSLFLAAALFLLPLLLLLSPPPPPPPLSEKKKESERISRLVPFCFCTRGLSSSRLFSPFFFHSPSFLVLQPLPKTKKTLSLSTSYWKKGISQEELLKVAADVEAGAWKLQADAGVALVGLDGTLYDQVLDWTFYLGLAPPRFSALSGLDKYFAMARGTEGAGALDMSKFFDTNYHYMVPELDTATLTGSSESFRVLLSFWSGGIEKEKSERRREKLTSRGAKNSSKPTNPSRRHPRLLDLPRPRQARPGRDRQGRRRPDPHRAQHARRPRQARRGHDDARQGRGRQGARAALRGGAQGAQGARRARGADARADPRVADRQRPARGL